MVGSLKSRHIQSSYTRREREKETERERERKGQRKKERKKETVWNDIHVSFDSNDDHLSCVSL